MNINKLLKITKVFFQLKWHEIWDKDNLWLVYYSLSLTFLFYIMHGIDKNNIWAIRAGIFVAVSILSFVILGLIFILYDWIDNNMLEAKRIVEHDEYCKRWNIEHPTI